jgi:hypothetical protein
MIWVDRLPRKLQSVRGMTGDEALNSLTHPNGDYKSVAAILVPATVRGVMWEACAESRCRSE